MALTYVQRHELIRDAVMGKRLDVAIWMAALAVLQDAQSTVQQKQEARARLKRPATDVEQRICAIRVAGDPAVSETMTDTELQIIVNSVYNQLPAPT